MGQQEDMVAPEPDHDDEARSSVAVSSAAGGADQAGDGPDADVADLDADEVDGDDGTAAIDRVPGEPRMSVGDLELEGEIAADYIEGLLDVADLDGDIVMDVEGDRAVV